MTGEILRIYTEYTGDFYIEKSAALKRLKKRCLCMVLSLLLAFGFAANEAFGFEFPPDADEPILNETEIALSEKVMNLELAVRTMKTKKKNRFLTFCFSLMPGAAEM